MITKKKKSSISVKEGIVYKKAYNHTPYLYREAFVHRLTHLHRGLVDTKSISIRDDHVKIGMERLRCTYNERCTYDEDDRERIWFSLLETVAFLHSLGIAHRDIKIFNVGLRENGEVVLYDYGSCKPLYVSERVISDVPHSPDICTRYHRPPEKESYGLGFDSWSLGIVALYMWGWVLDDEPRKHLDILPKNIRDIVDTFLQPQDKRKTPLDFVEIKHNYSLWSSQREPCLAPIQVIKDKELYVSICNSVMEYIPKEDRVVVSLIAQMIMGYLYLKNPLVLEHLCRAYEYEDPNKIKRMLDEFMVNGPVYKNELPDSVKRV